MTPSRQFRHHDADLSATEGEKERHAHQDQHDDEEGGNIHSDDMNLSRKPAEVDKEPSAHGRLHPKN